jgi:hypothetical protein
MRMSAPSRPSTINADLIAGGSPLARRLPGSRDCVVAPGGFMSDTPNSHDQKQEGEQKMSATVEIKWLRDADEHDYPSALSYLCLLYDEQTATTHVHKLKRAAIAEFKARDIFRA